MNTNHCCRTGERAATLLTVLIVCSILCASVVGYLSLVEQQNQFSARSQAWNIAITVAEAGVEEGLEHLNSCYPQLGTGGWTFDGTSYTHSNSLASGSSYLVTIDPTTDPTRPTIVSRASITLPQVARNDQFSFFAAIGGDMVPSATTVRRGVRVQTERGHLLIKALAARDGIDFGGNHVHIDSFDSSDPNYSTDGYYDPGKSRNNADVVTSGAIANAAYTDVHGSVATGPGGSPTAGFASIQSGPLCDNMNFTFPQMDLPFTTGFVPTNGNLVVPFYILSTNAITSDTCPDPPPASGVTTNVHTVVLYPNTNQTFTYTYSLYQTNVIYTTNTYDNILNGGNYVAESLPGKTIVLGEVRLVLSDGLNIGTSDEITIAQGASLEMYVCGTNAVINVDQITNLAGRARNCMLYFMPGVTSLQLLGDGRFRGAIVAPHTDVTLVGQGLFTYMSLSGAVIARSLKFSWPPGDHGYFYFHYDEALARLPPDGRFLVTSWDEVN